MTYENLGSGALDYFPCRYGKSRLLFRGPRRDLAGEHIAFLGGNETYGKFITTPFPALVERQIGVTCANFGWLNAGIDAYLGDHALMDVISDARVTVVQVMGAQNMSNRFYSVHPRRNDRFVGASALMRTVFREVDFTEYHFTKAMLHAVQTLSPDRFCLVRDELKNAWLARMKLLLNRIQGKTILLWLANDPPSGRPEEEGVEQDPLFVDRTMIEAIRPHVTAVVEVVVSAAAKARGVDGMVFSQMEAPVASQMMGPAAHEEAAEALAEALKNLR